MVVKWSQVLKVVVHVLSSDRKGLPERAERSVTLLLDRKYSIQDAGIGPEQVAFWKNEGMLPRSFNMDRVYFSQVIWLRFLESFNRTGIQDNVIKGLMGTVGLDGRFLQQVIRHIFMSTPLKRLFGISNGSQGLALLSKELVDGLQRRLAQLTVFDVLTLLSFAADTPVCLLVTPQGGISAYVPTFMGHDADGTVEGMMADAHTCFPLHRLAEGLDTPIPVAKNGNLVSISVEERALISTIRQSNRRSSVTAVKVN